jgi:hypothetical protein
MATMVSDTARIVGQLVVNKRMDRKGSGDREQQRMVIVGSDEGGNRNQTVAAGAVLDDH